MSIKIAVKNIHKLVVQENQAAVDDWTFDENTGRFYAGSLSVRPGGGIYYNDTMLPRTQANYWLMVLQKTASERLLAVPAAQAEQSLIRCLDVVDKVLPMLTLQFGDPLVNNVTQMQWQTKSENDDDDFGYITLTLCYDGIEDASQTPRWSLMAAATADEEDRPPREQFFSITDNTPRKLYVELYQFFRNDDALA